MQLGKKEDLITSLAVAGLALPLVAGGHPERNFIPPGTQIQVQVDNPVTVAHWDRGRIYPARVASDVYSPEGNLAIPSGSYCEMIVRQIGPAQMALDLESITLQGRRYVMDASGPQFTMPEDQYNSGSGLVGQIIGAITGNVQSEGDHIRVPAGSVLTFQLRQPLHVVNWTDEGYNEHGYHYHHEEDHGWYR